MGKRRLIDANALIAWCRAQADDPWNGRVAPVSWGAAFEEFIDCIGDVTPVDAVEVVHGQWEQGDYYDGGDVCSVCDWDSYIDNCDWSYCPNCGAKMDGDGNG